MKNYFILGFMATLGAALNGATYKDLDTAAISGMQGCYRVSFKFYETESFLDSYQVREDVYEASALEYVHFTNEQDRLVLQNIMKLPGGMYLKHWRQVWDYDSSWTIQYKGANIWKKEAVTHPGSWTQRVYQVDDSPRYECTEDWLHMGQDSSWTCQTWAPLPRREFSQRSDYQVLDRFNHHLVRSDGWDHAQDNIKMILAPYSFDYVLNGLSRPIPLVRETGLNTYEKISDEQCADVKEWWLTHRELWLVVQQVWDELYESRDVIALHNEVNGQKLYQALFGLVKRYEAQIPLSPESRASLKEEASGTIARWLRIP